MCAVPVSWTPEQAASCELDPVLLLQQVARLEDALIARDSLLAAASHELRNTVSPLMMLAEQLKLTPPARLAELLPNRLAMLTRNLRKFVATVDRMTEVAQLRDGKLALEISAVDLCTVVRDTTSQLRRLAAAGCADLLVSVPDSVVGAWDRARLSQIIANLVTNAVRHGVGGDVEVSVAVRENGDAELAVRDHGPGIAADDLDGIFERFDYRRSRTGSGFGIGLFVVKTLARALGGDATATNAMGGGARFSVVLPRA